MGNYFLDTQYIVHYTHDLYDLKYCTVSRKVNETSLTYLHAYCLLLGHRVVSCLYL